MCKDLERKTRKRDAKMISGKSIAEISQPQAGLFELRIYKSRPG